MTTTIERRIQALEERHRGDKSRIAVIHQNEDSTWPPEPSDAALVVAIRRFALDDAAAAVEVL